MSFNLELALTQWKQSLMKSGNFEEGDLSELEDHFRMTLEAHIKNGLSEAGAFDKILKEHYADLQEISLQYHEKRQVSRLASALLLNYFKVGYRTFGRHRIYFMINLFGLVLGLTSILSIILYLNHELNFDTFNTQHEQIHRVSIHYERASGNIDYPLIPPAAGPAFEEAVPEVLQSARLRYAYSVQMHHEDKSFYEDRVFFADPSFLEMFSYEWLTGNEDGALATINTIVLTESIAEKYFGRKNPIGKIITYDNSIDLKVIGVIQDPSQQSHLKFDFLISFDTYQPGPGGLEPITSWRWLGFPTYVKLTPGANLNSVRQKMIQVAVARNDRPPSGTQVAYELQPLADAYLYSGHLPNPQGGLYRVNDPENLRNLAIVAVLILVIAFFNYYNISVALIRTRTREIGVRKVFGASKRRLIHQMATESFLLLSLAAIAAWLIIWITNESLDLLPPFTLSGLIPMLTFSLGIIGLFTLCSGLLLGGSLSIYSTLSLLQQKLWRRSSKFSPANLVLLLQFGISAALIMVSFVVIKQLSFFSEKELGYNHEGVIVAKFRGEAMHHKRDAFVNALSEVPEIVSTSYGPNLDGSNSSNPLRLRSWGTDEVLQTAYFGVDYEFENIIDLEVLEGRYFSREIGGDSTQAIMINETLSEKLGFDNPIGEKVIFTAGNEFEIIGVYKNFHYKSLHHQIGPMALVMWLGVPRNVLIRYDSPDISQVLRKIDLKWSEVFPGGNYPLDYRFLDEQLQSMYGKEQEYATLLKVFTGLAIFIAILGLFGISSVNIDLNLKQIGIRRVLGADLKQITRLVSRQFLLLVVFATLGAIPIVYFFMEKWLANFAYAISLGPGFPLLALAIMLTVSVATLAFQVYRVMVVNPTSILKNE
ncbi:MAG: ABC transporter permease [Cytophagales bacterium]|nr:ABC transporter permease [Cytophagales bacterium]